MRGAGKASLLTTSYELRATYDTIGAGRVQIRGRLWSQRGMIDEIVLGACTVYPTPR